MNTLKQCCLCGVYCLRKDSSLFEHQLRKHSGICYSSVLKQFIRFDPPPPPLIRSTAAKNNNNNNRSIILSSLSQKRTLTTYTEKVKYLNKYKKDFLSFCFLLFKK